MGLDVIVTPVCDLNAPQCDCDEGVHDIIEEIGEDEYTLAVVDNNNSPITNLSTILLCNDVVWAENMNLVFIIPLNTIFYIQ